MKTFRWKVKPGMDVASVPSVRKVRFGDGYSLKAVYDMARKGARDEIQTQMRDGGLFSGGGR
ncbi:hypothetical protein CQA18_25385 [Enterobacter hormaechei]|nr:hypothetical protein CQA18_25385 [Enterobacter hormaechei]